MLDQLRSLNTEKPRLLQRGFSFCSADRPFQWPVAPTQGEREDVPRCLIQMHEVFREGLSSLARGANLILDNPSDISELTHCPGLCLHPGYGPGLSRFKTPLNRQRLW